MQLEDCRETGAGGPLHEGTQGHDVIIVGRVQSSRRSIFQHNSQPGFGFADRQWLELSTSLRNTQRLVLSSLSSRFSSISGWVQQ